MVSNFKVLPGIYLGTYSAVICFHPEVLCIQSCLISSRDTCWQFQTSWAVICMLAYARNYVLMAFVMSLALLPFWGKSCFREDFSCNCCYFLGDDLVIVVGAAFFFRWFYISIWSKNWVFYKKKKKKEKLTMLFVGSSDALRHLKINSEVRNSSILLPLSALLCLCSVHDSLRWVSCTAIWQCVWGVYGKKFSPYISVSWLVITPEMQLLLEEEHGEERLHLGRLSEAQVNPRKASKASGCAPPGSEADPRPVRAIMGLLRKTSLAALPWSWTLATSAQ